jgi:hypothetical protein
LNKKISIANGAGTQVIGNISPPLGVKNQLHNFNFSGICVQKNFSVISVFDSALTQTDIDLGFSFSVFQVENSLKIIFAYDFQQLQLKACMEKKNFVILFFYL